MRVKASCGGGKWVLDCTFLGEKQGLIAEALLDDSGMLQKPRKVEGQKNVVIVVRT